MSATDFVSELAGWLEPAIAGWRCLFSPTYRARVHEQWRHESVGYAILDVVFGILGIVVSVGTVWLLAVLTWQFAR